MEIISSTDLVGLATLATVSSLYSATQLISTYRKTPVEPLIPAKKAAKTAITEITHLPTTRSIRKLLNDSAMRCVVMYGTETGTAERLATMFAKDAKAHYGLECFVADLDDYDYDDLATLGLEYAVVYFIASVGEGEPTNNTRRFTDYLTKAKSASSPWSLQYATFGLGSTSYRMFNRAAKTIEAHLRLAGAHRVGELGVGDDGKGTLEDDFIEWSAKTMPQLAELFGLQKRIYTYASTLKVQELHGSPATPVLSGEPNLAQLYGRIKGPFTSQNPYPAPLKSSRQLAASSSERQCMHIEFDTSMSTLTYVTGDHLAIRPMNSKTESDRFLDVFGLSAKADAVIDIIPGDPMVASPVPGLTTYRAAVSSYINICGPVSRQLLSILCNFTSDETAKNVVRSFANDSERFAKEVKKPHLNLAQLLQTRTPHGAWSSINFAVLVESLGPLKPRYYSISSSSMASKKTISVTAIEEKKRETDWTFGFEGVSTSYLRRLVASDQPYRSFSSPTAYIHVRKSRFRLPKDHRVPVIMIGPGTGVAPFRAFVQERALQSRQGKDVGKTVLYYGCRNEEDFLYKDEWKVCCVLP